VGDSVAEGEAYGRSSTPELLINKSHKFSFLFNKRGKYDLSKLEYDCDFLMSKWWSYSTTLEI
jgi:hypothetical protein